MGKNLSRLKNLYRPVSNFNVEDRAFKVISRDKPTPAPPPKSLVSIMEEIKRDPDLLSRGKIDPSAMENLSQVFITSKGDNPIAERGTGGRKLPFSRTGETDYQYGYEEPKVIPKGKASMKQILEILSNQGKPGEIGVGDAEKIAQDYGIDVNDVKHLLEYYKPFQVHIPKKAEKPKAEKNPFKLLQQKIDNLKN